MTETIYSRLLDLRKMYEMKQDSMLTEDEYTAYKKDALDKIYNDDFITPTTMEKAYELKEKNILTEEEYDKIKKKLLNPTKDNKKKAKPKYKPKSLREFICAHDFLYYTVIAILIIINILLFFVSPILGFLDILVVRQAFKIK